MRTSPWQTKKHKSAHIPMETQTKLYFNVYTQVQNKKHAVWRVYVQMCKTVYSFCTHSWYFFHTQSLCQQQGKAMWQVQGKRVSIMLSINCGSEWDGILWHILMIVSLILTWWMFCIALLIPCFYQPLLLSALPARTVTVQQVKLVMYLLMGACLFTQSPVCHLSSKNNLST